MRSGEAGFASSVTSKIGAASTSDATRAGIGGGSILSPVLVGSGMTVAVVAPAALASTFVTSIVGACAFAVLGLFADGSIAPNWPVGIACGLGGLVGGYLGARLQPFLPERALRLLLGCLAVVIGALYLLQAAS